MTLCGPRGPSKCQWLVRVGGSINTLKCELQYTLTCEESLCSAAGALHIVHVTFINGLFFYEGSWTVHHLTETKGVELGKLTKNVVTKTYTYPSLTIDSASHEIIGLGMQQKTNRNILECKAYIERKCIL